MDSVFSGLCILGCAKGNLDFPCIGYKIKHNSRTRSAVSPEIAVKKAILTKSGMRLVEKALLAMLEDKKYATLRDILVTRRLQL